MNISTFVRTVNKDRVRNTRREIERKEIGTEIFYEIREVERRLIYEDL